MGRRCWIAGGIEEGEFRNGQPHGYCREIMADGSFFEGFWKDGWRHGQGKEILTCGQISIGKWENHFFIENNNKKYYM